jgi:hypothetical protein
VAWVADAPLALAQPAGPAQHLQAGTASCESGQR